MANSVINYTGDGVTTQWAFSFTDGYTSEDDITVRVNNEVDGSGDPVYRTRTFINAGLLEIGGAVPGVGEAIEIRRTTDVSSPVNDFENGTILSESALDAGFRQAMYGIQEALDNSLATQDAENSAAAAAASAVAAAADAVDTAADAAASAASAAAAAASETAAAVSAAEAAASAGGAVSWTVISDKPTTLAGFGITDAYTQTALDIAFGNKSDITHDHDGTYYPQNGGSVMNGTLTIRQNTQLTLQDTAGENRGFLFSNNDADYWGLLPCDEDGIQVASNRLSYGISEGYWAIGDHTNPDNEIATKGDLAAGGGNLVAVKTANIASGALGSSDDWFSITHTLAAAGNFVLIKVIGQATTSNGTGDGGYADFSVRLRVDGTLTNYMRKDIGGDDGDDIDANCEVLYFAGDTSSHVYTARTTNQASSAQPTFNTSGGQARAVLFEYSPD